MPDGDRDGQDTTTDPDAAPVSLAVPDAAIRAGVTARTMRRWLARGDVAFVRDADGVRRALADSLDAYLAARGTLAAPAPAPVDVPGLADLAAALRAEQARSLAAERDAHELRWQVGYLTAQLDQERQRVRLLEAGTAPDRATGQQPAEADTLAGPAPDADSAADPWWTRVRAWWQGGGQ